MSIFDLIFILLALAAVATLARAAILALTRRGARALRVLRNLGLATAVYFAIVIGTSAVWPRRVLRLGERLCFDDWCITVESASSHPGANGGTRYQIAFRLSSTALRVTQREYQLAVYLTDSQGRRYDPLPDPAATPFAVALSPGESVSTARAFEVPGGARNPGLIITHEGGFPIAWLIIGYESWFHKPAILPLPA